MFENVDGRTDGRTTDAGVTGILIAHLGAFGSGELKNEQKGVCAFRGYFGPPMRSKNKSCSSPVSSY